MKLIALGTGSIIVTALAIVGLRELEPAIPSIDRSRVWIDAVKRGSMVRQVRGSGTLVPELMLWIPAPSEGRLDKILLLPGTQVEPDTVLVELSNPELEMVALEAETMYRVAEAELRSLRMRLQSEQLTLQVAALATEAEYQRATLQAKTYAELANEGLVAELTLIFSQAREQELERRVELEQRRVQMSEESIRAQVAAQQARIDHLRAVAGLRQRQVDLLKVRAGIAGVLQQMPVEIGSWVIPGTNLAKVADPGRLKAELRIPETQARDVSFGQVASINTRLRVVPGRVVRIDPSVRNGTVTVDVALEGPLPKGVRPDLSVDGTIELARLEDVLYVGRPAFGTENSTLDLFRLDPESNIAIRVQVRLGRSSVNTVEVLEGLHEHDEVILSGMSNWDANERVLLE